MAAQTVGLNLLYLVPGETGGSEVVAREVVPRLPDAASDLEFIAFVNDETAPVAKGVVGNEVEVRHIAVSGRNRRRRILAEQIALPRLAKEHSIDLLHSFASTGPALSRTTSVVTVLDVIYAIEPRAHTLFNRLGMRVLVPLAARRADRVITISRSAAQDVSRVLKIPRERIDVTYLAGRVPGAPTDEQELRRRYMLGDGPIVLSVSARRPHKNLARLLRAFAQLDHRPAPTLVLPGYQTIQDGELERLASELDISSRVRFLGWISDADLDGFYEAASCFAFTSLVEGFGLPVLEALGHGLPVACSNTSSMPEVAGDAAVYFDPRNIDDIRASLVRLLGDDRLRADLAEQGRERAKRFSWERTARETVESYRRAWGSASRR